VHERVPARREAHDVPVNLGRRTTVTVELAVTRTGEWVVLRTQRIKVAP
jgi:hypothetical protein